MVHWLAGYDQCRPLRMATERVRGLQWSLNNAGKQSYHTVNSTRPHACIEYYRSPAGSGPLSHHHFRSVSHASVLSYWSFQSPARHCRWSQSPQ